jgi:hypothetical protein
MFQLLYFWEKSPNTHWIEAKGRENSVACATYQTLAIRISLSLQQLSYPSFRYKKIWLTYIHEVAANKSIVKDILEK